MGVSTVKKTCMRYMLLVFGLFIMAGGVALSAKSNLGVSPISSIPYVVSMMTDFTIGELTAIFNIILFAMQIVILRSNLPKAQFLQLPVGILFGYMIDINLILLQRYTPGTYLEQWLLCVASFILLGFGVFCEIKADVTMLSGEGLVSALTAVTGRRFSHNKVLIDSLLVVLAGIISFAYFTSVTGVREGTLAAAVAVGFFAGVFLRKIKVLDKHFVREAVLK